MVVSPLQRGSGLDVESQIRAHYAGGEGGVTDILAMAGSTDTIAFSGGFPAPEAFPVDAVARATSAILERDARRALQYAPTRGLPECREAIGAFITQRQGSDAHPSDVLVTSGGMEALSLLARVMLDRGACVAVEAPTYLGALLAFGNMDATLRGVPTDADGLLVDAFEEMLDQPDPPRLLYTIPDHQNPLGVSMSTPRRERLVEICAARGVLIAEDVAYRELGFDGTACTSLWSIAPEIVLQIGTFSKIVFPGNRIGWAVGPRAIVDAMAAAKQTSDQCTSAFAQAIIASLLGDGGFDTHLSRIRSIYASRAQRMRLALERTMPEGTSWTHPAGGFFVWLDLPAGIDSVEMVPHALAEKVAYVPGTPFYPAGEGHHQIRLAFSGVDEPSIDRGIEVLAGLIGARL